MKTLIAVVFLISCSTKSPPKKPLPEWIGKTRAEVREAFSYLTPKTEGKKITYRDTSRAPSSARCAVIPCYPWFSEGIDCTYTFKFKNEEIISAMRKGNCREEIKDSDCRIE